MKTQTPILHRSSVSRSNIPAGDSSLPSGGHLWRSAEALGLPDDAPRLWLHLADGRVLAFRVPQARLGDDAILAPLSAALADDVRGMLTGFDLPGFGWVQVLYAAPLPHAAPGGGLDDAVLDFLGELAGECFYASVRNYNRLAALPAEQRSRRLQALRRFPALLVPLLLTAHRAPSLREGKRHAWRQPDPRVEAAIDAGRDLTGALAGHYGVSRGLVRAPMNASWWEAAYDTRREFLALLDVLPDNRRPASSAEFLEFAGGEIGGYALAAYLRLLGVTESTQARRPLDSRGQRRAFQTGWKETWARCHKRFAPLAPALDDARDFLAAAREVAGTAETAAAGQMRLPAVSVTRLVNAWLAVHGLAGLLAASARWHRLRPQLAPIAGRRVLPAVLGEWRRGGDVARELLTAQALIEEGEAMRHCVGDYWEECVDGHRIFALRLACGARATAQYVPHYAGTDDVRYRLEQLRGPTNTQASPAMAAFAGNLALAMNTDDRREARRAALAAGRGVEHEQLTPRRPAPWLDPLSEQQLRRTLAWIATSPAAVEVLLIADIAGFAHHAGPALEDGFAPDQALALVREPHNPHDPLAVRLDWEGHAIGYVPRPENAAIAHALDNGVRLAARIIERVGNVGDPWHRVTFAVETVPACSTLTA